MQNYEKSVERLTVSALLEKARPKLFVEKPFRVFGLGHFLPLGKKLAIQFLCPFFQKGQKSAGQMFKSSPGRLYLNWIRT